MERRVVSEDADLLRVCCWREQEQGSNGNHYSVHDISEAGLTGHETPPLKRHAFGARDYHTLSVCSMDCRRLGRAQSVTAIAPSFVPILNILGGHSRDHYRACLQPDDPDPRWSVLDGRQ